jgi:hypothetical protein
MLVGYCSSKMWSFCRVGKYLSIQKTSRTLLCSLVVTDSTVSRSKEGPLLDCINANRCDHDVCSRVMGAASRKYIVCHLEVHIGQTPGSKGFNCDQKSSGKFPLVEPLESDTFRDLVLEHPFRQIAWERHVEVHQYDIANVDKPPKESLKCWNSGHLCKP